MIKAVIFDMDGVLINSEPLSDIHLLKYLENLGITPPEDYLEQFIGVSSKFLWSKITKDYNLPHSVNSLSEDYQKSHFNLMLTGKIKASKGVKKVINALLRNSYRIAVASSGAKKRIKTVLEIIGLHNHFEIIITGDDIKNSKPHPEIFLLTADSLGISPKYCLVIEDSQNGIIAAKRAGMKVVGFKGHFKSKQDLSQADLIVKNFKELTLEKITSI